VGTAGLPTLDRTLTGSRPKLLETKLRLRAGGAELLLAEDGSGAVLRLGAGFTGTGGTIVSFYGTNPSYVDLMQRTFTRENEKAILGSLSYDFAGLGAPGLSAILNVVGAFDGRPSSGSRSRDAQELNLTIDYKIKGGWLDSFWLRVRGSWLHEQQSDRNGTDLRVILRYDFPAI
jgi:hypothetical protein